MHTVKTKLSNRAAANKETKFLKCSCLHKEPVLLNRALSAINIFWGDYSI